MEKNKGIDIAIAESFISPAEVGKDLNDANVVDGLFAIARAINALAAAIRLTPVAGDGAGGPTGDVVGESRPAPER